MHLLYNLFHCALLGARSPAISSGDLCVPPTHTHFLLMTCPIRPRPSYCGIIVLPFPRGHLNEWSHSWDPVWPPHSRGGWAPSGQWDSLLGSWERSLFNANFGERLKGFQQWRLCANYWEQYFILSEIEGGIPPTSCFYFIFLFTSICVCMKASQNNVLVNQKKWSNSTIWLCCCGNHRAMNFIRGLMLGSQKCPNDLPTHGSRANTSLPVGPHPRLANQGAPNRMTPPAPHGRSTFTGWDNGDPHL